MAADRPRHTRVAALALALVVVLVTAAAPVARAAVSNELTAWTDLAQQAVRTINVTGPLATRVYALVGLAAHKAIVANPSVDPALAAAYASHNVLSTMFPWLQSSTYDALLKAQLGDKTPPARAARDSIRAQTTALVASAIGGPSVDFADAKAAREGAAWSWRLAPMQKFALLPQLGDAAPLVATPKRLDDLARNTDPKRGPVFRPPADALRTADYETTFKVGNATSAQRTPYDTGSAMFWAGGMNTSGISGQWLQISTAALPAATTVAETALFLARAFGAAWDASVLAYKLKYEILRWRPITAFRQGYPAQGRVPAFAADPSFTPLLMTPPHPEYPSGHQAAVGAVLEVLLRTLGGDKAVAVSVGSEGAPAMGARQYGSLEAAAAEVGDSRVYGGVHFNGSCVDGLSLGRLLGGEAFENIDGKGPRRPLFG